MLEIAASGVYSGGFALNGGVLEITASGGYSGGFAVNAGTLEVAGRGVIDNSGPLSGSGTVLLACRRLDDRPSLRRQRGALPAARSAGGPPPRRPSAAWRSPAGAVSLSAGQTMTVGNGGLLIAPGGNATFNMTGGSLVQGGIRRQRQLVGRLGQRRRSQCRRQAPATRPC